MTVRVGINGFGRIGRAFLRQSVQRSDLKVVAINDLSAPPHLAHLLKYDSSFGPFQAEVGATDDALVVNGRHIYISHGPDPTHIDWTAQDVQVVVDSTGRFTDAEQAQAHLDGGAKKVVISAPGKDNDLTVVMGVNSDQYDPAKHHIISNASCTTNCLAPVVKVIHENFGLLNGLMTTVHAYTLDQRLLDSSHRDWRRARAAGVNIVPTTTGAAQAVGAVMPELEGRLNGFSLRVPTTTVSIVDLVAQTEKPVTAQNVNDVFRAAAADSLQGIVDVCDEPLVSSDFKGSPLSAIIDAPSTMTMGDHMVKVMAWYDNEWGYAARLADLVSHIYQRGL